MVEKDRFREVMGHFPTGVTIVTARDGKGEAVGLTVSAFTSVSLEPTLILVCVHRDASAHEGIVQGGSFAVNVLTSEQAPLAWHFAEAPAEERFRELEVEDGPLGDPLISGSLAWLTCRVREVWPGGDHSVILGEVTACDSGEGDPLLFHRGELRGVAR